VNASFVVNFFLFIIQMYAAISTGSLSLFATAADAFMDLVSSCVMLITSRMAARPSVYKYPVGRTRIETIGIIMFCCLMTTVAIQLIVSRTNGIVSILLTVSRLNLVVHLVEGLRSRRSSTSFQSSSWPSPVRALSIFTTSRANYRQSSRKVHCASTASSSVATLLCTSSSSTTAMTLLSTLLAWPCLSSVPV
jgi:Co/Zn/Cd efflux system component